MNVNTSFPRFIDDKWNDSHEDILNARKLTDRATENSLYSPDGSVLQRKNHHYFFTYGTLKAGFARSELMNESKFVGTGFTKSHGFSLQRTTGKGTFPILEINGDPATKAKVYGEIYLVPTSLLYTLDIVESNGHIYTRNTIPILVNNREKKKEKPEKFYQVNCFTYIGCRRFWETRKRSLIPCDILAPNAGSPTRYYNFLKRYELSGE